MHEPAIKKLSPSEVGRLGALARAGKYKAKARVPKGRKPAATPEEKEAARRQKAQEQRAAVATQMGVSTDDQAAMDQLAKGEQPENPEALIEAGIFERGTDGTVRFSGPGKVFYNAASRGDAGAAGDAIGRGKDRVAKAGEREKAKADKETTAAEKKPAGGGGGGGKAKPTNDEKKAEAQKKREQTATDTLGKLPTTARLKPAEVDALRQAANGEAIDEGTAERLTELGFLDGAEASDQGRAALSALEQGNVSRYLAAAQNARNRLKREAEAKIRKLEQEQKKVDKEAEREARNRRQDELSGAAKAIPEIADDAHTGAMVCLAVPDDVQEMLQELVEGAEADHVTIAYLGDATALEDHKALLIQALASVAQSGGVVEGSLGGFARFNASAGSEGQDVLVALVDSSDLPPLHHAICEVLGLCGVESPSEHGFIPHITLSYVDAGSKTPDLTIPRLPVSFSALSLVWAGERIDIPFFEAKSLPPAELEETPDLEPGEIKMLDDDSGVAMAVRFGSADEHDLSGKKDFYTKSTDFWLDRWGHRPMLYEHAQTDYNILGAMQEAGAPPTEIVEMKAALDYLHEHPDIGTWTKAWSDTMAVWMSYELNKAHRYKEYVKQMIQRGLLKVSTDSAPHLVVRVPQPNGTNWVKRWPIIAGSVTTHAAEPRLWDMGHTKSADASDASPAIDAPTADSPEAGTEAAQAADVGGVEMLAVKNLLDMTNWRLSRRYVRTG